MGNVLRTLQEVAESLGIYNVNVACSWWFYEKKESKSLRKYKKH